MSDTMTLFEPVWARQAFDGLTYGKFDYFSKLSARDWADWIRHRLNANSDLCTPGSIGSENIPYTVFSQLFHRENDDQGKLQSSMLRAIEQLIRETTHRVDWHGNSGKMLFSFAGSVALKDSAIIEAAQEIAWERYFVGVGIEETEKETSDFFIDNADLHYYVLLYLSDTDSVSDEAFWQAQLEADKENTYGFPIFKALTQVNFDAAVGQASNRYFSDTQINQLLTVVPDLLKRYEPKEIISILSSSGLPEWRMAFAEEIEFLLPS